MVSTNLALNLMVNQASMSHSDKIESQIMRVFTAVSFLLYVFVAGCSSSGSSDAMKTVDSGMPIECIPNQDEFSAVQPVLESACGMCHGDTPQFGAPYSLTDYSELVAGSEGERQVDAVRAVLLNGTMPPAGQPMLTATERTAVLDWVSCGSYNEPPTTPMPGGFDVSREVYPAPADTPAGADALEFLASGIGVRADELDRYRCFGFRWPTADRRLIRRFEAVIDDARVVHHIVLYETTDDVTDGDETSCGVPLDAAVYAWAPGSTPLQFVDGGLRTSGEKRYVMEIHYNNSGAYDDVADRSGIRIYHEAPGATEIDMLTIGPEGFEIPGESTMEVEGQCPITEPLTVLASMPHMHELGQRIGTEVIRADGSTEDMITLSGWDFDTQLFYDTERLQLNPGDRLETRCVFQNPGSSIRRYGPNTEDEMCYNFLYVTPPPSNRRCDGLDVGETYQPGACAVEGGEAAVNIVQGVYHLAAPPEPSGGTLEAGTYVLKGSHVYLETDDFPPVTLDVENMTSDIGGLLTLGADNVLSMDLNGTVHAVTTSGIMTDRDIVVSFAGDYSVSESENTMLDLAVTCPNTSANQLGFTANGDQVTIHLEFEMPLPGTMLVTFELAP